MPTYVYEEILPDGEVGETFEIVQQMSEPVLEKHPTSGNPVRRVFLPPFITGLWTDMRAKSNLSEKKLEKTGFTKYVKMGDGVYEKRTGQGPDLIKRD